MSLDHSQVMRFRVIADADPSALIVILQHLRRNRVTPKSVSAHRQGQHSYVEVKIELDGLSDEAFHRLVNDVNEMPLVVAAVAFDVDWTQTTTQ